MSRKQCIRISSQSSKESLHARPHLQHHVKAENVQTVKRMWGIWEKVDAREYGTFNGMKCQDSNSLTRQQNLSIRTILKPWSLCSLYRKAWTVNWSIFHPATSSKELPTSITTAALRSEGRKDQLLSMAGHHPSPPQAWIPSDVKANALPLLNLLFPHFQSQTLVDKNTQETTALCMRVEGDLESHHVC